MEYEADLKQRIEKFEEKMASSSDILLSLAATNKEEEDLDPLEAEVLLSYYKELIEGVLLLDIYNNNFFDPELKEQQEIYEEHLETVDKFFEEKERRTAEVYNIISKLISD